MCEAKGIIAQNAFETFHFKSLESCASFLGRDVEAVKRSMELDNGITSCVTGKVYYIDEET